MCTVSYLPGDGGYVLTSNRDEDPARETHPPEFMELGNGLRVVAPRDQVKGGTWLAADAEGRFACLMNGAFGKHKRQLPYRKSRGLLVLEAMEAPTYESYIMKFSPKGMEPFTLLLYENGRFWKLAWDGTRKYTWELQAASRYLWSSPTLYDPVTHAGKEHFFKTFLAGPEVGPEAICNLHGSKGATPFVLEKPGVRTVSISQLVFREGSLQFRYFLKPSRDEEAVLRRDLTA